MGFNLEVPLEIVEYGMNSATTARDSTYQRINLDPSNYDGATYYFEIVAVNTYASSAYNVTLRYSSTDVATISVPASTSARTRIRSSSFSPASGNQTYFVRLPATNAASNVIVYEARVVVVQANATKTRIQIPLLNRNYNDSAAYNAQYVDNRNVASDGQSVSRYFPIWKYDARHFSTVPASGFAFETCLASSNASGTATVSLYNKTDGTIVKSVTRASTTPAVVTGTWSAGDSNWHDGDEYEVRHKISSTSYYSRPGNAYLYITLNPIASYEVVWKISKARTSGTSALINEYQRAQLNPNNYDNETVYFEATGFCSDNGNRVHLQDDTTNESGTAGSNVSNADINFNSGTKARVRATTPLSLTNADRFIVDIDSSTNNLELASAWVIFQYSPVGLVGAISNNSRNLLPLNVANGAESGTVTNLTSYYGGGTRTADSGNAYEGSYAIKLNNGGVQGGLRLADADLVPVSPSTDYVVSFYRKSPSVSSWIAIIWYNSSKTELSYSNDEDPITSTYTRHQISGTSPSNAAYVSLYFDVGVNSYDAWIDNAQIELGTSATAYVAPGVTPGIQSSVTGELTKTTAVKKSIEVPLEMADIGCNSDTTARTHEYTKISLTPDDYDGATYYFEIVATNSNTSNAYNVSLYNTTTSSSMVSQSVPASTTTPKRYRTTSFTPTSGNNTYAVRTDATASSIQVVCYSARIIIVQVDGTKTRIQVPLTTYYAPNSGSYTGNRVDGTTSVTDTQGNAVFHNIYKLDESLYENITGYAFEVCLNTSSAGGTSYASLYNKTDNTQVNTTEVNSTTVYSSGADLKTVSWTSPPTNWHDLDEYETRIRSSSGSYYAYVSNAKLYIYISGGLDRLIVPYRVGKATYTQNTERYTNNSRVKMGVSNYSTPYSVLMETVGYCSDNAIVHYLMEENADYGTSGSNVSNTGVNFNSATKARVRGTTDIGASLNTYNQYTHIVASTNNSSVSNTFALFYIGAFLKGSASAQSGVSGVLTVPIVLSGTIGIQSSATGVLTKPSPLVSTVAIQSSATGVLSKPSPLSSTIGIQASSSGILTKPSPLTGTVSISTTVTGVSSGSMPLIGTLGIQSSSAGILSKSSPLSGGIGILSTVDGVSKISKSLTGVIGVQGYVAGSITDIRPFIGLIGTQSTADGVLKVVKTLTGSSAIQSQSTGVLSKPSPLSGTTTILSTVNGGLTKTINFTGTSTLQSLSSGVLKVSKTLVSSTSIHSNVNGLLSKPSPLTGTSTIVSAVSGVVSGFKPLTGTIGILSAGAGVLTKPSPLTGTVTIIGVVGANLRGSKPLVGTSALLSGVNGVLSKPSPLTGVVIIQAVTSGDVKVAHTLSGGVGAISYVAGSITDIRPLIGLVSVTSSVTGVFKLSQKLDGISAIHSGVTGVLSKPSPLVGSSAFNSTVNGVLPVGKKLTGTGTMLLGVTGILTKQSPFTGIVGVTSTIDGVLSASKPLSGQVSVFSTVNGGISVVGEIVELTGTTAIVSLFSGSLSKLTPLSGTISSLIIVNGGLGLTRPLDGVVVLVSTTGGLLNVSKPLSGQVSILSSVTSDLTNLKLISGLIESSLTLDGLIGFELKQITGYINGVSATDGLLSLSVALTGVVELTSAVTVLLTVYPPAIRVTGRLRIHPPLGILDLTPDRPPPVTAKSSTGTLAIKHGGRATGVRGSSGRITPR